MPVIGQIPVTLRNGKAWDKSLPADAVIFLLMLLLQHDYRANDNFVFKVLGIDMKERRRTDNVPYLKNPKTKDYRIINRGAAMELLSALLLCHLDMASEVRAMCQLRHGLPHKTALDETGDIYVRYVEPDGSLAFRVVAEVSSQKFVDEDFYRRQLNQAWKFADRLAEDDEDGLVYGLVINRGHIISSNKIRGWFREFAQEKELSLEKNVRVVPIYTGDLCSAAQRIQEELDPGRLQFSARTFGGILDALMNMLIGTMQMDAGDDAARDTIFEGVFAEQSKELEGRLDHE